MTQSRIKTVEVLQIAAGLTAALRWAIALMPLDGMRFALNEREWFEPVSFGLSLAFAAVEIGATAYIMRAWRKETDKATQASLMLLWMVALALMVVAQVPPLIANIDGVSVATFPTLLKVVWVTCGVAVTFVVIGGVGYAEKSLEAQPAASTPQPAATMPQGHQTATDDTPNDTAAEDTAIESSQTPTGSDLSDLDAEPVESTVVDKEPRKSPVLSTATFDDYQLTGDTRADLRALLALAPLATNASLARKVGLSPERVRQIKASLSQEAQGVKP